ncbi:PqqD family peptide modification chaperone [Thermococcus sp. 2319x1]|uniref:PqqD family peptide modification chaperone n=1 Tax=Thermococcus sp. 2319x1 TaxID=1674923 RepID=UPI001E482FB3|nr:PqqD family peptide modification chaperone [Thermococcus sp. 2319x1]
MKDSSLISPFYYDYPTGRIFTVNKIGELVPKYGDGSLTIKEIANRIKEDIDEEVSIETITKDILEFIEHLLNLNLLQNDEGRANAVRISLSLWLIRVLSIRGLFSSWD